MLPVTILCNHEMRQEGGNDLGAKSQGGEIPDKA